MSEGGYWVIIFAYCLGSVVPFPKVCEAVGSFFTVKD